MKHKFKITVSTIIGLVIIIILLLKLDISLVGINNISDILSNIINFVAITTGFLMTTLSILASSTESKIMKKLVKFGKIEDINLYFVEPFLTSIVLVILCVIEQIHKEKTMIECINSSMICVFAFMFIIQFLQIGFIAMKIIEEVMREKTECDYEKTAKINIQENLFRK